MRIPSDALIPITKLTQYLLVPKQHDDKSIFLAQGGFTLENPQDLLLALQRLIQEEEAAYQKKNEYGVYYQVSGILIGSSSMPLGVTTIWLQRPDGQF